MKTNIYYTGEVKGEQQSEQKTAKRKARTFKFPRFDEERRLDTTIFFPCLHERAKREGAEVTTDNERKKRANKHRSAGVEDKEDMKQ